MHEKLKSLKFVESENFELGSGQVQVLMAIWSCIKVEAESR